MHGVVPVPLNQASERVQRIVCCRSLRLPLLWQRKSLACRPIYSIAAFPLMLHPSSAGHFRPESSRCTEAFAYRCTGKLVPLAKNSCSLLSETTNYTQQRRQCNKRFRPYENILSKFSALVLVNKDINNFLLSIDQWYYDRSFFGQFVTIMHVISVSSSLMLHGVR